MFDHKARPAQQAEPRLPQHDNTDGIDADAILYDAVKNGRMPPAMRRYVEDLSVDE